MRSNDSSNGDFSKSYIPTINAINEEINRIASGLETHFTYFASSINEALRTTLWLPDAIKPARRLRYVPVVARSEPVGYLEYTQDWISRHRAITAAIVAFVGTGAFIIWRRRSRAHGIKRRARRAKNGSRTEVIVLAGSPYSPLTRSLSLDLERRGFIVYIPVNSLVEEQLVQSESRLDIRPLSLDITSPTATANTLSQFETLLSRTHYPLPHTSPHTLHLASFIVLPSRAASTGLISNIHPVTWSETLNSQLIAPITMLHAFFPLLTTHKSSLLFLTPSIVPSLTPPLYGLENVAVAGMQALIKTLRKEVASKDVNVVQFRLGTFDYPGLAPSGRSLIPIREYNGSSMRGEENLREESARGKYAREDATASSRNIKGSPLRELHFGVFDAIVGDRGRGGTIFVGKGSRAYDYISRFVPETIIGWMTHGVLLPSMLGRDEDGGSNLSGSTEWGKLETEFSAGREF